MVRQLPIIERNGKRYFKDDRLRQIRNVENPYDFVEFDEMDTDGGE
ncbi:MAG: hypothetical protein KKA06_06445 [Nanoarchaeota archaeon]|nr:hypothetical protein [Nanoarchaeota archaeon]